MIPEDQEQSREVLRQENALLKEHIEALTAASDVSRELVLKEFKKSEQMLRELEERAAAEQALKEELEKRLREAEARERELATERARLEDMQIAAINMMEDIAAARTRAEAATRAKSEFLANMSHEIRTPMTAIVGFAENVLEPDQSASERINAIHTIRRNGQYLLGIINDILDLSKIEANKMTIERIPCNLCRLVAEVASLVRVRTEEKGLAFHIEYLGAIPDTIRTDPTRLRQILINLIGNAVKFTEEGGVRLIVRFVDDERPYMQFDVLDTGLGMTEEQTIGLFQAFTQADATMTRKFGGTGLGLTISKRFTNMLGGDITLIETKQGNGTRFRATIDAGSLDGVAMLHDPMSATDVEREAATTAGETAPTALRDCHVLLAEDGKDNQRLITHILSKVGASVTVEENGKLAMETAVAARDAGTPFHVILMDMQMPVMDGYEAVSLLRERGYEGAIVAVTAHAMKSDRQKCLDAGCDDYATKPIDRKRLIETVRTQFLGCIATWQKRVERRAGVALE